MSCSFTFLIWSLISWSQTCLITVDLSSGMKSLINQNSYNRGALLAWVLWLHSLSVSLGLPLPASPNSPSQREKSLPSALWSFGLGFFFVWKFCFAFFFVVVISFGALWWVLVGLILWVVGVSLAQLFKHQCFKDKTHTSAKEVQSLILLIKILPLLKAIYTFAARKGSPLVKLS